MLTILVIDSLSERLRREIRNLLGSSRAGSNPAAVEFFLMSCPQCLGAFIIEQELESVCIECGHVLEYSTSFCLLNENIKTIICSLGASEYSCTIESLFQDVVTKLKEKRLSNLEVTAAAAVCCILVLKDRGIFLSIRNSAQLLNLDPFLISNVFLRIKVILSGTCYIKSINNDLSLCCQQFLNFFCSLTDSELRIPSSEKERMKSLTKKLLNIAASAFEGHYMEPTALATILLARETILKKKLKSLEMAMICKVSPSTLAHRHKSWHNILFKASRHLPWSQDITKSNFEFFFYQIVELIEADYRFPEIGDPVSFKVQDNQLSIASRVTAAQKRILFPVDLELDDLDSAIETLLCRNHSPNKLQHCSKNEILCLLSSNSKPVSTAEELGEDDLTLAEEAEYIIQNVSQDKISIVNIVNGW